MQSEKMLMADSLAFMDNFFGCEFTTINSKQ